MAKWNGEVPTINLTDDELLEARRQQFAIGKLVRQTISRKQHNSYKRRKHAASRAVQCAVCAIKDTCEKRTKYNMKQCTYGFVESAEQAPASRQSRPPTVAGAQSRRNRQTDSGEYTNSGDTPERRRPKPKGENDGNS